jgi:hypothetical protein
MLRQAQTTALSNRLNSSDNRLNVSYSIGSILQLTLWLAKCTAEP